MKYLLIGSVFSDLNNLPAELNRDVGARIHLVDVKEIRAFNEKSFSIACGKQFLWDNLLKAFIRYPYDLLPPFSAEFRDREKTEFWKSICLLSSSKSLNCPMASWGLRNRFYSLKKCADFGLKIPQKYAQQGKAAESNPVDFPKPSVLKALGNCFVGEGPLEYPSLKKYCLWMQDGNDEAFIFPAQLSNMDNLAALQNEIGVTYSQDQVSGREFRVYSIGDRLFAYEREKRQPLDSEAIDMGLDMSDCRLLKTDYYVPSKFSAALQRMKRSMRLNYACLDVILDPTTEEPWVIDFNPLGSLPDYDEHPEVTRALAVELVS